MDWATLTIGVLTGVAAVTGVRALFWWHVNEVVVAERRDKGGGVWQFRVRNDGSQVAEGVEVFGYGCRPWTFMTTGEWWRKLEVADRDWVRFTVEDGVDPDAAWFVVMWRRPEAFLGRRTAMWVPLTGRGPLAELHAARLQASLLREVLSWRPRRRIAPDHSRRALVHRRRWRAEPQPDRLTIRELLQARQARRAVIAKAMRSPACWATEPTKRLKRETWTDS